MEKDTKHAIIVVVIAVAVIAVGFIGLYKASGVSPPQTIVVSESMQHGIGSNIGVIDTGDVIIVKDKDKLDIQTYVDGYHSGYQTFGDYGNVIIYERGDYQNPVIHRAILWLDYNGNGTWSAPSLENYPYRSESDGLWSCTSGSNYMSLSGTLTLYKMGYGDNINPSIDLDTLARNYAHGGYLTMGDNNSGFDQQYGISKNGLIEYDIIRSVAWIEIPWLGSFKMILNGETDTLSRLVPNTIPSLAGSMLFIIFLIVGISFLFDYRYYSKIRKELDEERNAPTPSFLVEEKNE